MVRISGAPGSTRGNSFPVFLVVLLLGASGQDFLAAQSARFRRAEIRGQILPPEGALHLPNNVAVRLIHRDSRSEQTADGRSGSYSFQYLGGGYYFLELSAPGYELVRESVQVEGALRGQLLVVNLRIGEPLGGPLDIAQPGKAMTVSAGQLSIPRKVQENLDKAAAAAREKRPAESVRYYRKALDKYPRLPRVWNNLAVQYLKLGQMSKAKGSLVKALELDPTDNSANFNLALILFTQRDFVHALTNLQLLIQLKPQDLRVRSLLAESYLQTGHYELALQHYEEIARQQPDTLEWLVKISDCYVRLGSLDEAISSLERFLARSAPGDRQTRVRSQLERLRDLRGS